MQTFTLFILGSAAIAAIWVAYLLLNNILDKLDPGFVQEVLGTAMSFAMFMAIGLVLYHAGDALLIGWSVVLFALGVFLGLRKLLRLNKNDAVAAK